jgi:hypothetical protein
MQAPVAVRQPQPSLGKGEVYWFRSHSLWAQFGIITTPAGPSRESRVAGGPTNSRKLPKDYVSATCDPMLDPPCACSAQCTAMNRKVIGWTFAILVPASVVAGILAWIWHTRCSKCVITVAVNDQGSSTNSCCLRGTFDLLFYVGLKVYDVATDWKFLWELAYSSSVRALALVGLVYAILYLAGWLRLFTGTFALHSCCSFLKVQSAKCSFAAS